MTTPRIFPPDAAETLIAAVRFDESGLVPAIAQEASSGEVLMLAWMNDEAIRETLGTGQVTYWSRSRGKLWRKGESSGQVQRLLEIRIDCDGDALLALVEQTGVACHTGRRTCFHTALTADGTSIITPVEVAPADLYDTKPT